LGEIHLVQRFSVINIASTTDDLQTQNSEAVDIHLVAQLA
jgi:hypothetical protein